MRGAYARGEQVAAKRMSRHQANVAGGAALFQRVFTRLGCEGRPPRFRVEFYAYSSLVLTIRRREESVYPPLFPRLTSNMPARTARALASITCAAGAFVPEPRVRRGGTSISRKCLKN